jgi:hypothetical protein
MAETEKPQAYLSVDFGEQGGQMTWTSHDEATKWVTKLLNDWAWVSQPSQNVTQRTWELIHRSLNPVIESLQRALNYRNQNNSQADAELGSAKSTLENFIRGNTWLLPHSAQRHFVEALKDSGLPLEAALIVASWFRVDMSGVPIQQFVKAMLYWELNERGIKDRVKSESATLKRLAGDMQTQLTQYQEAERIQSAVFDSTHKNTLEQTTQQQADFEATQQLRDTSWNKQLTDTQAELTLLKETYDKHMALAAPVDYWETKRKRHSIWSLVSGVAIVICMFVAAFSLHTELQSLGKTVTAEKILPTLSANSQPAATTTLQTIAETSAAWHLGSFILLATLSFWFIRLLVRIFLSSLHLENDASERVTMAKTYLALLRNGNLPSGDSINTILAALFRPSGDGIVKDEGVPPTTLDWFTKLGGK